MKIMPYCCVRMNNRFTAFINGKKVCARRFYGTL